MNQRRIDCMKRVRASHALWLSLLLLVGCGDVRPGDGNSEIELPDSTEKSGGDNNWRDIDGNEFNATLVLEAFEDASADPDSHADLVDALLDLQNGVEEDTSSRRELPPIPDAIVLIFRDDGEVDIFDLGDMPNDDAQWSYQVGAVIGVAGLRIGECIPDEDRLSTSDGAEWSDANFKSTEGEIEYEEITFDGPCGTVDQIDWAGLRIGSTDRNYLSR